MFENETELENCLIDRCPFNSIISDRTHHRFTFILHVIFVQQGAMEYMSSNIYQ